jgi:uncharacterized protein
MTTLSTDSIRAILSTHLGNERPAYVFSLWEMNVLTDETLRDLLCEVWTEAWPSSSLPEREWLAMFDSTGFVSLRTTKPKPTKPVTVFRGAALSTNGRGFSWTFSREVAKIYAELRAMSGIAAGLFKTTVPPDAVLAMLREDGVSAGEDEVVVDPRRLSGSSTPQLAETISVRAPIVGDVLTSPEMAWWDELLERVVSVSPRAADSPIHGERHWRHVANVGLELANATPGADERVVLLFALLHDCRRENEYDDPGHGKRGAKFALELHADGAFDIDADQLETLVLACRTHTDGTLSSDATVGVCFDADRLDLGRVGIEPDSELMSTAAGRERLRQQIGMGAKR